jgi:hypothetical protein
MSDKYDDTLNQILQDIKEVTINRELPKRDRMIDYIRQIKNPYIYKTKGYVVEVEYSNNESTIKDNLIKAINSMASKE